MPTLLRDTSTSTRSNVAMILTKILPILTLSLMIVAASEVKVLKITNALKDSMRRKLTNMQRSRTSSCCTKLEKNNEPEPNFSDENDMPNEIKLVEQKQLAHSGNRSVQESDRLEANSAYMEKFKNEILKSVAKMMIRQINSMKRQNENEDVEPIQEFEYIQESDPDFNIETNRYKPKNDGSHNRKKNGYSQSKRNVKNVSKGINKEKDNSRGSMSGWYSFKPAH